MKLVFRPEAEADLIGIYDYVAEDSSPTRAAKLVAAIRERCMTLKAHPRLGRARPELRPDLRSLIEDSYVILYRVQEPEVEIVNIVHGSRDIESLF